MRIEKKRGLAFISYLDDNDKTRNGYFEIIFSNGFIIKFRTNDGNIITLPYSRILKIKERIRENEDG